jgi:hypothetical protein
VPWCAALQVNLAQNLTAAFWKYSGMADGEDGDEDADDMGECCRRTQLSCHAMLSFLEV